MSLSITTTAATDPIRIVGGRYFFDIYGTWGGTSIALQWSDDGVNFRTLTDLNGSVVAIENNHNFTFNVSQGFLRLQPTGGSGISLSYSIGKV